MPRGGFTGRLREASSRGTQLKELEDVPPELENIFTLFDVEVSPEEEGDEETVGVHSPTAPDLPDRYGRKIIHLREDGMLYPTKDVANICLDVFHKIVLPDAFFQKSLKQHHIEVYWLEFKERVLERAEELRAEGEDPDYDAIFLELFGRVKKRKQVPGAGQATSLYFPFATSSAAGSASSGLSCLSTEQVDELLERRVQPLHQEIEELRELVKVLSQQVQASCGN
ncbi:uncharacterized protein LOC121785697 [Salvia splendens]|uniref:uncharacterized protein LOC121785697 n=1 Tax=Salvia splendens TaxID=180675 RepID=UPI001C2719E9|nr:uncharacterized protein LOC121785697 [Salvia splendens]XP_042040036.1 uncharacterized protein LOC121785697 [Salvia splendens]XP_042040037.1 uncharacterized protein LOC121785697 [Salvia splendens]